MAIIVTNSSNSMAPLLSASTCNDDDDEDYGKDDEGDDGEVTMMRERMTGMMMVMTSTSSTMSFNSLSVILSPILRSTVPSSCFIIVYIFISLFKLRILFQNSSSVFTFRASVRGQASHEHLCQYI